MRAARAAAPGGERRCRPHGRQPRHLFPPHARAARTHACVLAHQRPRVQHRPHLPGRGRRSASLRGDEWQVDARIVKWKAFANLVGFDAAYRLERISGRYDDIAQERGEPHSVFPLAPGTRLDTWAMIKRFSQWLPWVDALYGSAVYVPMADGAVFEVMVSQSGLLVRPAERCGAARHQRLAFLAAQIAEVRVPPVREKLPACSACRRVGTLHQRRPARISGLDAPFRGAEMPSNPGSVTTVRARPVAGRRPHDRRCHPVCEVRVQRDALPVDACRRALPGR